MYTTIMPILVRTSITSTLNAADRRSLIKFRTFISELFYSIFHPDGVLQIDRRRLSSAAFSAIIYRL